MTIKARIRPLGALGDKHKLLCLEENLRFLWLAFCYSFDGLTKTHHKTSAAS